MEQEWGGKGEEKPRSVREAGASGHAGRVTKPRGGDGRSEFCVSFSVCGCAPFSAVIALSPHVPDLQEAYNRGLGGARDEVHYYVVVISHGFLPPAREWACFPAGL